MCVLEHTKLVVNSKCACMASFTTFSATTCNETKKRYQHCLPVSVVVMVIRYPGADVIGFGQTEVRTYCSGPEVWRVRGEGGSHCRVLNLFFKVYFHHYIHDVFCIPNKDFGGES